MIPGKLGLFANISMYSHYVCEVLYSTRAAQNGIFHQKYVDRLNFITTVARITYTISCRSTDVRIYSYGVPWSRILQP